MNPSTDGDTNAYAVCEALAEERAAIMKQGEFADGYRCAAMHIATAIRRERETHGREHLERELRDAEIEAQALGRVVQKASAILANTDPDSEAASTLRRLLSAFFADDDLPPNLRRPVPKESTTRLTMTARPPRVQRRS